jgi:hypothetical protein
MTIERRLLDKRLLVRAIRSKGAVQAKSAAIPAPSAAATVALGIGVLWQDAVLLAHLPRSDSGHCLSILRLRYIAGPMLD